MIIGLKKWNNPDTYYTQVNNPTEEILRKKLKKGFLETCGPTAAINVLAARDDNITIKCPGKYKPQPEEVLTDYFNDPANYKDLQKARKLNPKNWLGNEIPQFYSIAIPAVFNVTANYQDNHKWENIKNNLKKNIGIMILMKNPGHFVGVVAFDCITNEVIYNDPWPRNNWPESHKGKSGFNRRMTKDEYQNNIHKFIVTIGE